MEWILLIFLAVLLFTFTFKQSPSNTNNRISNRPSNPSYRIGNPLFSPAERSFFGVLQQAISDDYTVMGKVRVADILIPAKDLNKSQWQTAFNRIAIKHFDFVLCDKNKLNVVAAVELDDKSHNSKKTKNRDALLNSACESAGFPLIRFSAKKGYQIADVRMAIRTTIKVESENVESEQIS